MKILVMTGPPYSGKGTQCEIIAKETDYAHLSTGEAIRKEKDEQTELGKLMSQWQDEGKLVPDEVMEEFVEELIKQRSDSRGIILDGYPRTVNQVETIIRITDKLGHEISQVINIEVPKEELLKRALKRAETSDRIDDQDPQKHIKRIEIFEEDTKPAISYLNKRIGIETVNGLGKIEEITVRIKEKLKV